MDCSLDCIALLVSCYSIRFSRTLRDILGVKICEVFLCFLTIIFLGSIVWLLTGFFVWIVLRHSWGSQVFVPSIYEPTLINVWHYNVVTSKDDALHLDDSNEVRAGGKIFCFLFFSYCWSSLFPARPLPCLRVCSIDCIPELRLNRINSRNHLWLGSSLDHTQWF